MIILNIEGTVKTLETFGLGALGLTTIYRVLAIDVFGIVAIIKGQRRKLASKGKKVAK